VTWLALSLALSTSPAPQPPAPWRVYVSTSLHVGVRPAALVSTGELAAGVTVQLSAKVL
jgi:hypothetical protein